MEGDAKALLNSMMVGMSWLNSVMVGMSWLNSVMVGMSWLNSVMVGNGAEHLGERMGLDLLQKAVRLQEFHRLPIPVRLHWLRRVNGRLWKICFHP